MSEDCKGKRLELKSFKFSNKRWLCDQNMIETQRQRHLASSFGDRRSRQVRHDHINYWNCSTGRSEDIFVWKATGTHGLLKTLFDKLQKLFHREIRRREEDIFVQMGLGQSYWISFYTLVCVCVCSTWCRQMMILTKTFISTATRKKLCWGDIFLNASGRRC